MLPVRLYAADSSAQIAYPAAGTARFDAFYESWRDALLAYAAELNAAGAPRHTFTADFSASEENGALTVVCTLRIRRRGHIEAQKRFTYIWRDDALVLPEKPRRERKVHPFRLRFLHRGKTGGII